MKKFWMTFSRLLVGAVFIFSGFVKGVDPLGTAYKFGDYFAAYGTDWANAFALFLSISLCALEFAIGVALFFNLRMKITAWALLVIMMFFTILTFFDAIYAPVPDCGCFGDAIKLTNWETFYKNLVLMIFVIIIFRNRTSFKSVFSDLTHNILLVLVSGLFIYFSVYNYRHLPMIDFRVWKVGNKMTADADSEMRVYVKYRNTVTGEIREYLSPDFPWNDPAWLAEWEFFDQRTESDSEPVAHNLKAEDEFQNDFTPYILESNEMFVVVAYDIGKASQKGLTRTAEIEKMLTEAGYTVVLITSSLPEEVDAFQKKYDSAFEVFYADDVVLKTMIRSNPGLVLFHQGYVAGKWHHNDFPDLNEIKQVISTLDDLTTSGK
jgi:uncharacterized membrane protein YphA (DoxX/SURF4 family)